MYFILPKINAVKYSQGQIWPCASNYPHLQQILKSNPQGNSFKETSETLVSEVHMIVLPKEVKREDS